MKDFLKKWTHKTYFPYFLLLVVAVVVGLPLLQERMINGHDGIFHLFRINTTKVAILDHQLIPMVNPQMMGGFGYASNLFYGVLSSYCVAFLSFFLPIGFAANFVLILSIFGSGVTMYLLMKDLTEKKEILFLASVFYMIAPYHLFDLYVRCAYGEVLAFVFIPLVFHGINQILFGNKEKWYLLTFGTAGLILTHSLSAFLTGIFAALYLLFYLPKLWNKQVIFKFIISLMFALLLSLPNILPLLEAKQSSDYLVFDSEYMKTTGEKMENSSISLFENNPDPPVRIVQTSAFLLGLVALLMIFSSIFQRKKICPSSYFFLALFSVILTLDFIPWRFLPQVFSTFQFPWRFLQISSFFSSATFGFTYQETFGKNKKMILIPLCICLGMILYFGKIGFVNEGIDSNLLQSNALKKRGEIVRSTGTASAEYLPRNAIYNYSYLSTRNHLPIFLEGQGLVTNTKQEGTHLKSNITVFTQAKLELPYLYYPGYVVLVNQEKISPFETENGMVGITLEKGTYQLTSYYRGTSIMIFSYTTSILTTVFLTFYICFRKKIVFWKE